MTIEAVARTKINDTRVVNGSQTHQAGWAKTLAQLVEDYHFRKDNFLERSRELQAAKTILGKESRQP